MSKSVRYTRRRTDALQSHNPDSGRAAHLSDKPTRRDAPEGRYLLERLLNTPHLEQVIPGLQPDLLHRVIQTCGLEDCSEIVALTTPGQLAQILDLDLWRAAQPGRDEQFDADRFGVWIEVLVETGADAAAQKLAAMDADLVVAGLAQHALICDCAVVMPCETLDGEQIDAMRIRDDALMSDIGGYRIVARRTDSWDAIVAALISLEAGHPDCFHQVMRGCRSLSDSGREVDGLDDLLSVGDQAMFDLAVSREQRREKQGYVMPAQARAFLQMSRERRPGSDARPPANPLAPAYFRDSGEQASTNVNSQSGLSAAGSEASSAKPDASEKDTAEAVATVFDVLHEAGLLAQTPRALPGASAAHAPRLNRIQICLACVFDRDKAAWTARNEELAWLANTFMAGCSIQSRPFTTTEASQAAIAVCNLGLENWPLHWLQANAMTLPDSFLVEHDLISVFQVGWAVLHQEVSLYATEQLIGILTQLRCADREIQAGLNALRSSLTKYRQAGTPWRARDAMDVLASLDLPTWAVLLALIDECPVLHAGVAASGDSRTLSVSASDFEFISENSQLASVREFMQTLPETLCR